MTEDQGVQTKTEVKRLRIEHSFLSSSTFKFVYEDYAIVLQSRTLIFRSRVWPALQDCNNRASDDEPAMLGYRSMTVGNTVLAHKAPAVR